MACIGGQIQPVWHNQVKDKTVLVLTEAILAYSCINGHMASLIDHCLLIMTKQGLGAVMFLNCCTM